jgi:hypothetical protein
MRRHRRYAQLAPHIDPETFHETVRAEYLISAHLDPAFSTRVDNPGVLDLAFMRDGRVVVVPFLTVQGAMLYVRESSPFIWPAWLPPLRADVARAIEDEIEPWLRALSLGRFLNGEILKCFSDDAGVRAVVAHAAENGFLGAAPADRVLASIAPYVYALRFANGNRVAIVDGDAASGAAILARWASVVDVDLGDARKAAAARQWFDLDIFGGCAAEGYDLSIGARDAAPSAPARIVLHATPRDGERLVEIAPPIPAAVMVSFDRSDGDPVDRFAVAASPAALRDSRLPAVKIVGDSKGRIALVLRDDHSGADDSDVDAARALAARLSEQGFAPTLTGVSHAHIGEFDVYHVFGYRTGVAFRAVMEQAGKRDVPLVLTPYADDPRDESPWGIAVGREILVGVLHEATREMYADAMRDRKLSASDAPLPGRVKLAENADVRSLFASLRAAVVAGDEEERYLRKTFAFTGVTRAVPALLGPEPEPADIGALVGPREFVFIHAPVDSRWNQYALVRAAATLGYPVVLLGPVQNIDYYAEVMAALGEGGIWLPGDAVGSGELAALYRRARVFADASWSAGGLYRLARAAMGGAALVAPTSGYARNLWPGLAQIVDPASLESIHTGLREAWERAPALGAAVAARTAELCDPFNGLVAVLAAYQQAATPAVS